MRRAILLLALVSPSAALAAKLPHGDGQMHTGVATCATSVCHGRVAVAEGSEVQLNEFHMWSTDDYHSRAFQVLRNDASKAMAAALGLPAAQNAKICLDCHADNVPTAQRGQKFQLSDGVGCEACHGGAEHWLKSHTDPGASHADNLSKGLYPLSDPAARAELCLSCHLGTKDKYATHAIMAAGHPRLSFELDTFTANQPAHYTLDADYIDRKRSHPMGLLWAAGQLAAAQQQLTLIELHQLGKSLATGGIELAIYDCHSCHRGLKPRRGRPADFSAALPSGGLRLADHSLDMVAVIVQVMAPERYEQFAQGVTALHLHHSQPQPLAQAIAQLQRQLAELASLLPGKLATTAPITQIRRTLVQQSAAGRYADFSSAEQAFLAMESLSFGLADRKQLKGHLDSIYRTLADENLFQPEAFAQASAALLKQLP
jgi:hypothetical protein